NGIIGLDFDDDDAALIISDVLPEPLVCKVGERGWTAFYQADFDVPSENFYDANGRLAMQVLGRGRQTVIPPSIHPDTKKPYYWPNGRTLFDTLPSEHTLLPRDYRELILKLGYKSERGTDFRQESAETYDPETGQIFDADSDFAEVNGV